MCATSPMSRIARPWRVRRRRGCTRAGPGHPGCWWSGSGLSGGRSCALLPVAADGQADVGGDAGAGGRAVARAGPVAGDVQLVVVEGGAGRTSFRRWRGGGRGRRRRVRRGCVRRACPTTCRRGEYHGRRRAGGGNRAARAARRAGRSGGNRGRQGGRAAGGGCGGARVIGAGASASFSIGCRSICSSWESIRAATISK